MLGRIDKPFAVATAIYCGIVFWLSHQSHPPVPDLDVPLSDKLGHVVVYAGLAFLASMALYRGTPQPSKRTLVFGPLAFATLYGLSDEVHQLFIPGRFFELADLAADAIGALLTQSVFAAVTLRERPLNPAPEENG